jgi:hypothetical protein
MLAQALEAEVEDYLQAAEGERDGHGHALVVRNGYARGREILLGAGSVEVRAPRVSDKRVEEVGRRRRFKSVILPPYMRRSPKVTEVLPLLYLHGLSSGDFVPALKEFFGSEAGLSSAAITLRTTNPIESVFAPVRARTDITKGPGSRRAGLAVIFKLMEAAEGRWRKLTGSHLVALVGAGAKFRNGGLVEGSEEKVAA